MHSPKFSSSELVPSGSHRSEANPCFLALGPPPRPSVSEPFCSGSSPQYHAFIQLTPSIVLKACKGKSSPCPKKLSPEPSEILSLRLWASRACFCIYPTAIMLRLSSNSSISSFLPFFSSSKQGFIWKEEEEGDGGREGEELGCLALDVQSNAHHKWFIYFSEETENDSICC